MFREGDEDNADDGDEDDEGCAVGVEEEEKKKNLYTQRNIVYVYHRAYCIEDL